MKGKFTRLFTLLVTFALSGTSAIGQYCSPAFSTGCTSGDLIQNVSTQNGITNFTNNNTGCSPGAYTYYSGLSVSEQIGGSFDFTVQAGSSWSQGFRIWVDWNQDNDFMDPGEDVWNSVTSSTSPYNGTITVPANAIPGTTRMRVRCSFVAVPTDPCNSQTFGEVEDYNVVVISPSAKDIQFVRLTDPVQPPKCYTTTETVKARVKNTGQLALDFSTDPLTVNVAATGPNPTTFIQTVSTGILPVGDSLDITMSTTYDMTAFGTYVFNGVALQTNDSNQYNDTLNTYSVTTSGSGGTVTANTTTICNGNTATLSISGITGTHEWQVFNGSAWVGTGVTTPTYAVTPTTATQYRAQVCGTTNSNTVTVTVISPTAPVVNHGTRCGYGPVTLAASGTGNLVWYDSLTAGNIVAAGNGFIPVVGMNDTFYVENQVTGGTGTAGPSFNSSGGGVVNTGFGLNFTVISDVIIDSVAVYAIGTAGNTTGTVTVDIVDGAGNMVASATETVSAVGGKAWVSFPATLSPGTYRMLLTSSSNLAQLWSDPIGTFPYNASTGDFQITSGWNGSANNSTYYYFYDWRYHSICRSPRSPAYALVTPAPPMSAAASDTTICQGDTITLTATSPNTGYSYQWSPLVGLITSTGSTVTANPPYSVNYIVEATDGAGCAAYDTVSIITSVIPVSIASVTPSAICDGQTASLNVTNATGSMNYNWTGNSITTPSSAATTANPTTGTTPTSYTYTVVVTDPNTGCAKNSSATLTVNPNASLDLGPDTTVCQYSDIIIDAGNSYSTYLWNNNEIGQVRIIYGIPYTQTVTATVTNQYGCSATDSRKYTVVPRPLVNIGPDVTMCINHTKILNAGPGYSSYLWSNGDTTQSTTAGPFSSSQYVWVTVTNAAGCSNSDSVWVNINPCASITEYDNQNTFRVYPNPNDGNFSIALNTSLNERGTLVLTNIQGQIVLEQEIRVASGLTENISLDAIPPGVYLVRILSENMNKTERVVIR